jgi:DoxX-like family
MKAKTVAYWVTTILLVLELAVGAEWDIAHRPDAVQVVMRLEYPGYVLTILGFWKLLAVIALLMPGFGRLKEWAYAGAFFEMTGATASHVIYRDAGWHTQTILTVCFAALTVASWALRPPSRTLGALFPTRTKD